MKTKSKKLSTTESVALKKLNNTSFLSEAATKRLVKRAKNHSKKLSARARKQDVPNAWYHSLKARVEELEGRFNMANAMIGTLCVDVARLKLGRKK